MPKKRAIIFDFGGVIVKTRDYHPRHRWDERLGLPHGSVEAVVHGSDAWKQAQSGTLSIEAYWAFVAETLKISTEAVQTLARDFYSGDQVDRSVVAQILAWRSAGHTLGLLSNDSPALEGRLHKLGLYPYFDAVLISGNLGVMKPDAGAYRAMLNALQRPAKECIFIDDMGINVAGAATLGIYGLHYADGMALDKALAPLLIIKNEA